MIEDEKVGEGEGGLGYAEVELDSPLIGDLGVKYMVWSLFQSKGYLLTWMIDHVNAYTACIQ
jgi:hypothetical protein